MSEQADFEEFLTTLEGALKKWEKPKELWAPTLIQKLPNTLRMVTLNLHPDEQADHASVVKAIQAHVHMGFRSRAMLFSMHIRQKELPPEAIGADGSGGSTDRHWERSNQNHNLREH